MNKFLSKRTIIIITMTLLLFVSVLFFTLAGINTNKANAISGNWIDDTAYRFEGSGKVDDPYLISAPDDLGRLAYRVNVEGASYPDSYFLLTNDLDMGERYWTAIGTTDSLNDESNIRQFRGIFNGNGYTISNLTISSTSGYQGLFGYVIGAQIYDLGVSGSITADFSTGGIVGYAVNSTITNCYNKITINATGDNIGGIVGHSIGSTINSCYNSANIKGNSSVGGVIGYANASNIIDSYNTGVITGNISGGVAGTLENSSNLRRCYGNSEVYANTGATDALVGGIMGNIDKTSTAEYSYYNKQACSAAYPAGNKRAFATVNGRLTSQMTVSNVSSNMVFDFTTTWIIQNYKSENGKVTIYFPQLRIFYNGFNKPENEKRTQAITDSENTAKITYNSVNKPTSENKTYSGSSQFGVIYDASFTAYTLVSGSISGINAGNYTSVFALKEGFIWSDGTFSDVTITFTIASVPGGDPVLPPIQPPIKVDGSGTVLLENWAYGEAQKTPSFTILAGDYVTSGVKYYYKSVSSSTWQELSQYPNNVGMYDIRIEFAETYYYNKLTLSSTFSILPIYLTNQLGNVNGVFVYNGSEHTPAVYVNNLTADDYTVSYSNNINAGIATVTITGKGVYAGSLSTTFIISKAQGSGTVTLNGWTENKTANSPIPVSATNGINNVTYHYKKTDEADSLYTLIIPSSAGDYIVRATFGTTSNYNIVVATYTFTISQALILPDPLPPKKDGLSAGAIVGIVVGSVAVAGGGGFAVYWFIIRKRKIL